MPKQRILLTGANGLLGHQLVFQLLELGYDINIIVRSTQNIYFDSGKVSITIGQFDDYDTLKQAARHCDGIIHVAAITSTNLLHYSDYHKINVEASALIIRVANELSIAKLIFLSTANTIGYGSEHQRADEACEIQAPFADSFYAHSKLEAEYLFAQAAKAPNRHVIIIHPSFMIGSHDTKPSSGRLILMGYKKRFMLVPQGGKNFVAASYVAQMACKALEQGENGGHYLATDRDLSFAEYFSLQSAIGNYPQRVIVLPKFVLIVAGWLGDLLRKAGIKTDLCTMNIRQLLIREYYSNAKAVEAFGAASKTLENAIKEALEWFRLTKKIK